MLNPQTATKNLLARRKAEDSYYEFVKQAWPLIEGGKPFIPGWHIEAACAHMEALYRGDILNLLINMPPRMSKPVWVGSFVQEKRRGRIALSDVCVGDEVLTHLGRYRKVLAVHEQGVLPMVELHTWHGRSLRLAPDHPVLTPAGWVEAGNLTIGDILANVAPSEDCGTATVTPEEARLLGYLIGDGSCISTQIGFTNANEAVLADVERCAASLGFKTRRRIKSGCAAEFIVILPEKRMWKGGADSNLRAWLKRHEIWRKSSYQKCVPPAILGASDYLVSQFIGAYWSCDGFVSSRGVNRRDGTERTDAYVGCDSVNRDLLIGIQSLLMRLRIGSRIRKKVAKLKTKRQGDLYTSWHLALGTAAEVGRFVAAIPVVHSERARKMASLRKCGFDRLLREDELVGINDVDAAPCRCLTVEEDGSFTANDIVVKNSTIVSVMFTAWCWIHNPSLQFLYTSYSSKLSFRDSRKCRQLIESEWYQKRWGHLFSIVSDSNTKERFDNNRGGYRVATSVDAMATGEGGDFVIADDPNHANDISETMLEGTIDWWSTTMSTRVNDFMKSRRMIVQQRTNERDLSGFLLADKQNPYVHLMLPMEFEPERRCVTVKLPGMLIPWRDPRTEEGELLCPARIDSKHLAKLKAEMGRAAGGTYAIAGQLQQRPAPSEGGLIKRSYFNLWRFSKAPKIEFTVMSFDTALTKEATSAESCALTFGVFRDENKVANLILLSAWNERVEYPELRKRAQRLANDYLDDGPHERKSMSPKKPHVILIEKQVSGHSLLQDMRRAGVPVTEFDPKKYGDKMQRVWLTVPLLQAGRLWVPGKPPEFKEPMDWCKPVIDQAIMFPNAALRDMVDAMSQALNYVSTWGLIAHPDDEVHPEPIRDYDDENDMEQAFY